MKRQTLVATGVFLLFLAYSTASARDLAFSSADIDAILGDSYRLSPGNATEFPQVSRLEADANAIANSTDFIVGGGRCRLGDVRCDGYVDFFDARYFQLALTEPRRFFEQTAQQASLVFDMNLDGTIDFDDIPEFLRQYNGQIPEPPTLPLLLMAILAHAIRHRPR